MQNTASGVRAFHHHQPPSIHPPEQFVHHLYDIPPSNISFFFFSLTLIGPHHPPPPSLSLMGTGHQTHEKGVRVFFPATEWFWHMMIGGPTPPVSEGGIIWVPRLCSWTWEWRWRSSEQGLAWCSWSSQCRSVSAARRPPRQSSGQTQTQQCWYNWTWRSQIKKRFVLSWGVNKITEIPALKCYLSKSTQVLSFCRHIDPCEWHTVYYHVWHY